MKKFLYSLVICALFLGGTTSSNAQLFFMENPLIGKKAPDFELQSTNGKTVSLNQLRSGKRSIVFFWATWCPHCRTRLGELNDMKSELTSKGIKIIPVDVGEASGLVKSYVEQNDIAFDVLLDVENTLSETYSIVGVPTFFFLSADGTVQAVEHSIPENYEEILLRSGS